MSSIVELKFYKLPASPTKWEPNAVYFIYDSGTNTASAYITDLQANPVSLFDATGTGGVQSVTGTGVTGTLANPIINISTFLSNQTGNMIELSAEDNKLFVKAITSPTDTITITETSTELQLEVSQAVQDIIMSALQSGDNVSELVNDAGYITLDEVPTSPTNLSYTASPTQGQINSDTGADAILPVATLTNAGLLLPNEKTDISTALQPGDNTSQLTNDGENGVNPYLTALDNYWTKTANKIRNNNTGDVEIQLNGVANLKMLDSSGIQVIAKIDNVGNIFAGENGTQIMYAKELDVPNGGGVTAGSNRITANPLYWRSNVPILYESSYTPDATPERLIMLKELIGTNTILDFQYPLDYTFRPFKIFELHGEFFADKSNKDIVKDKISKMKPYYLNYVSGSNSNDGLTDSTAFKTLSYALSQGAQLIYLADKDVVQTDGWGSLDNTTYGNKDIFVISKGRTFILNNIQSLVYTLDTGNTYTTTIGANTVPNVIDMKFVNEYGFPLSLVKQTSIAAVNSTINSYYITGTSLYVHLQDGRVPDSQVQALKISTDNRFMSDGSEYFYGEGLSFLGGNNAFSLRGVSGGHVNGLLNKCNFMYANLNGLGVSLTDNIVWSEDCIAFDNGRDGFNYTQPSTSSALRIIEINCIGFSNGIHTTDLTSALNGSSAHNKVTTLRIGGKYFRNRGPNVIDVNGAKSLNIGVECFDSVGFNDAPVDPTSPGVNWPDWGDFGTGTVATEAATQMWLYGCKSKDTRLSFGTPQYLSDNTTLDLSAIYVNKSTYTAPTLNNIIFTNIITGLGSSFTFPVLSSYTAGSPYQPIDTDLTAIAALTTTSFGRGFLTLADASASRTYIGAGTITAVSGATNRITSTGGTTPSIDISSTFEALLGKVANPLSQFAATTSSQLASVISDETGTGLLVFNNAPTLINPVVGTQTANDNSTKGASTAYADAKVQNSLIASTTVAPAATAINTALALKYDAANFLSDVRTSTIGSDITGGSTSAITSASSIRGAMWQLQNQLLTMTSYVAKTTTYTITTTDYFIDCTTGTFTVTLPSAVGIAGKKYVVKNSGAGVITIATTSSQTIDGSTTKTLSVQYGNFQVVSDGANWKVISAL